MTVTRFSVFWRAGVLLLLATVPAASAGPVRWWDRDYAYRKRIALSSRQTFGDSPSASIRLGTGGRLREDAADLRVVSLDGRVVPHAVLGQGPDDLVEVAFPVDGEREWFVYYGNPGAKPPRETFVPDRGLVLTTFERGPGLPLDWPSMQEILAASTKRYGGSSWPRVFDAENPFGPDDDFVSDYRGFLLAPKDGTYTFYTASDEASFLLVDDGLVVSWPGWHTASEGAWAKFSGKVKLEKGLHRFRYVHVERKGNQVMAAYWLPPGAEKATVIPPTAFPGHRSAEVVRHERRDGEVAADFEGAVAARWGRDDRVYTAVTLKAQTGGAGARYAWVFGDGLEGEGPIVTHVYLEGGDYDVMLAVQDGGESDTVTRRIRVPAEWTRFDRNTDTNLARFARIAATYPGRALRFEALENLAFLLREADREDDLLPILRAAVDRGTHLDPGPRYTLAMDLGETYRDRRLDLDGAIWAFSRAAETAGRGRRDLEARVALAGAHLLLGGNPEIARKLLETAVEAAGKRPDRKEETAWLRLGDARMATGDPDGALAAYRRAEEAAGGAEDAGRLLRKAAAARSALTWIETGDPERAIAALRDWERFAPLDRWSGIHRLARARALLLANRPDLAVRELTPLLDANPESEYAPEALAKLADLAEAAGEKERAADLRARLRREYPWSPLAK